MSDRKSVDAWAVGIIACVVVAAFFVLAVVALFVVNRHALPASTWLILGAWVTTPIAARALNTRHPHLMLTEHGFRIARGWLIGTSLMFSLVILGSPERVTETIVEEVLHYSGLFDGLFGGTWQSSVEWFLEVGGLAAMVSVVFLTFYEATRAVDRATRQRDPHAPSFLQ